MIIQEFNHFVSILRFLDALPRLVQRGDVFVTRIAHDQPHGSVVQLYCPICRRSDFVWSPYACKPEKGDYFRIECCEQMHLGMVGTAQTLRCSGGWQ